MSIFQLAAATADALMAAEIKPTLRVGEFCYYVSAVDAEFVLRGRDDAERGDDARDSSDIDWTAEYRPAIVVRDNPHKYPLDFTLPSLDRAQDFCTKMNMTMGLVPSEVQSIFSSSMIRAIKDRRKGETPQWWQATGK